VSRIVLSPLNEHALSSAKIDGIPVEMFEPCVMMPIGKEEE